MYGACKFNAVYFKNGYLDRIETAQPYNIPVEHQLSFEISHNKIGATFIFSNFWVDCHLKEISTSYITASLLQ